MITSPALETAQSSGLRPAESVEPGPLSAARESTGGRDQCRRREADRRPPVHCVGSAQHAAAPGLAGDQRRPTNRCHDRTALHSLRLLLLSETTASRTRDGRDLNPKQLPGQGLKTCSTCIKTSLDMGPAPGSPSTEGASIFKKPGDRSSTCSAETVSRCQVADEAVHRACGALGQRSWERYHQTDQRSKRVSGQLCSRQSLLWPAHR
jgi:hypothetical protein